MKLRLTAKITLAFFLVIAILGALAIWTGIHFIADGIVKQAQNKVVSDLNSSREIYQENLLNIKDIVRLTAARFFIKEDILGKNRQRLYAELNTVRIREFLDILSVTDPAGKVILRSRNPRIYGDKPDNELVRWVLNNKEPIAGTTIIPKEELLKEGEVLAELAYIKVIPTPRAKPTDKTEETSGMVLSAAAPIFDQSGNLLGVLYGGRLLNKNYTIVDKIKDVVFRNETYKGRDIGTATIFLGDIRISTNVRHPDGKRAIGTQIAEDVFDQVLIKGKSYTGRAFVVNDWYISAYEPIRNITGKVIGILYVGILEKKFIDMKKRTITAFLGIVFFGIVIAITISQLLARTILKPLRVIVQASRSISQGNFNSQVAINTKDELAELGASFNFMASSLKERDEQLKEFMRQQLIRSERLATLGQLAAGVAHEINNPLSGVLTYIRLMRKRLEKKSEDGDFRRYLDIMEKETDRCTTIVRNLLDFARQSKPNLKSVNVNQIINESLELLAHKLHLQNVEVEKRYGDLPQIIADFAQLQQVFMNIIINAAEAMENGGKLTIITRTAFSAKMVEIEFTDTGKGIPAESLPKIFDPFFTTKPKGTGLGLSVVYGIINRHQGQIEVKSEVNKGTTFTIRLPVNISEK